MYRFLSGVVTEHRERYTVKLFRICVIPFQRLVENGAMSLILLVFFHSKQSEKNMYLIFSRCEEDKLILVVASLGDDQLFLSDYRLIFKQEDGKN